jgi:hypothetical protein
MWKHTFALTGANFVSLEAHSHIARSTFCIHDS